MRLVISPAPTRNYLRMRGEYYSRASQAGLMMELPPHARRIPVTACNEPMTCGTTSACAENTGVQAMPEGMRWNYLRMRGEYFCKPIWIAINGELPPHARRIRGFHRAQQRPVGTTSACAENTLNELGLL